jgi:uncharacterized membrane protein
MSDRALRLTMAACALATVGIASYLLEAHYSGSSVVCSTGGCETVAQSRYSEIFGVPVALIGLIGAVAVLLTLLLRGVRGRAAGVALTLAGMIFAVYLVVVQVLVLGAVCEWCVANDALLGVLALLALWRAHRADPDAFRLAALG